MIPEDIDRLHQVLDLLAALAVLQIREGDIEGGAPESAVFGPEEVRPKIEGECRDDLIARCVGACPLYCLVERSQPFSRQGLIAEIEIGRAHV